ATDASMVSRNDKEPPKCLVVVPEEAEIVRHAFGLYLEKRSIAAVRDYLKVVTDRQWDTSRTKYLLQNETYIGNYVFGQWRKDGAHEAILEPEIWQAVQQTLGQQGSRRQRNEKGAAYYLRGLVRCPHCGCAYTHHYVRRGERTIRYYACLKDMKRTVRC